MTSAPISEYSALQAYQGASGEGGFTVQRDDTFGSFEDMMRQAKTASDMDLQTTGAQMQTAASRTTQTTTGAQSLTANAAARTAETYAGKTQQDTGVRDAEKTQTQETNRSDTADRSSTEQTRKLDDNEKAAADETVEKTEQEVTEKLADELDVSKEDVQEAMETLGLTVMDLQDPANMAALVTQLSGESDPAALLTDENLFAKIGELTAEVGDILSENLGELASELDVDVEEALVILQAAGQEENVEAKTNVAVEIVDETTQTDAGETDAPDTVADEETAQTAETVTESEASQDTGTGQNTDTMTQQQSSPLINQMFDANTVETGEVTETQMPYTSYTETADIIDQIGEYVRIHRSEGMSEMEISLNPESLGNVHLQVASREGVITATITTQNETVRDALMVQAMVLKEELNEQGVKVDAVEVTVASREFEQQMQNGGEEAKNLFEQQVQKQTRRRIVIDSLKDAEEMLESENLSDAERLQIDMMAKSGNSVDFTA